VATHASRHLFDLAAACAFVPGNELEKLEVAEKPEMLLTPWVCRDRGLDLARGGRSNAAKRNAMITTRPRTAQCVFLFSILRIFQPWFRRLTLGTSRAEPMTPDTRTERTPGVHWTPFVGYQEKLHINGIEPLIELLADLL